MRIYVIALLIFLAGILLGIHLGRILDRWLDDESLA